MPHIKIRHSYQGDWHIIELDGVKIWEGHCFNIHDLEDLLTTTPKLFNMSCEIVYEEGEEM